MATAPPLRPRPVRPCPICGMAMQASKSREDLANFDTFQCLSCQTTIKATPSPAGRPNPKKT